MQLYCYFYINGFGLIKINQKLANCTQQHKNLLQFYFLETTISVLYKSMLTSKPLIAAYRFVAVDCLLLMQCSKKLTTRHYIIIMLNK